MIEHIGTDACKAGRKRDRPKSSAPGKRGMSDACHAVGNGDIPQRRAGSERRIADGEHTIGNGKAFQTGATGKRFIANELRSGGDGKGGDRRVDHIDEAHIGVVRIAEIFPVFVLVVDQTVTAVKHTGIPTGADQGQTVREDEGREAVATGERGISDGPDSLFNRDRGRRGVAVNDPCIHITYTAFGLDRPAGVKGMGSDGCYAIGNRDVFQLAA